MNWKDLYGNSRWFNRGSAPTFIWRNWETHRQTSFRVTSETFEYVCCCYANLISVFITIAINKILRTPASPSAEVYNSPMRAT
jgi:hypothetical protein